VADVLEGLSSISCSEYPVISQRAWLTWSSVLGETRAIRWGMIEAFETFFDMP